MADQAVTLRINANAQGLVAGVGAASKQLASLGTAGERGGKQASAGLDQARNSVQSLAHMATGAARAALGLGSALLSIRGAQQLARLADQAANIRAQLELATRSQAEYARAHGEVYAISQRTSTALASTATLYARLTRATEDLGLAESQRLQITDTINKAMVVSGASAQEASAAIIQLSQGLAAGALRGEEFNSVAEQAPILLDLVAQATGKTRGELRAMAQDGEITSAVLTGALLQGASTVDAQFANMGLTIGGAAQQMKNAALEWVGQSDAISGAADMTASALSGIGRNFAAIADAAANAALALSAVFAGRWLSGLRESVGAWNAKRAAMLDTAKATAIAAESEAVLAARENAAIQRSIQRATQDIRVAEVQLEVGRSATLRAAAEERLAIAHRQLAAAQNQLYDNTQRGIAARAALKEATDGVAKSTLNFANIGKSAFAMIGGWTTVIIAAAAAVYGIAESMVNGSAEVQKMTDDLNASSESMEKNAAAALKMRLGVSEGMAGAAVEVDKLTAKLAELQAQQESMLPTLDTWQSKLIAVSGPVGMLHAKLYESRVAAKDVEELNNAMARQYEAMALSAAVASDFAASYDSAIRDLVIQGRGVDEFRAKIAAMATDPDSALVRAIAAAPDFGQALADASAKVAASGADVDVFAAHVNSARAAWLDLVATTRQALPEPVFFDPAAVTATKAATDDYLASLRNTTATLGLSAGALKAHEAQLKANELRAKAAAEPNFFLANAMENEAQQIERAGREAGAAIDAHARLTEAKKNGEAATRASADATRDHARALIELEGGLSDAARAEADYKLAVMDAVEKANQQLKVGMAWSDVERELAASIAASKASLDEKTDSIARQLTPAEQLIADLEFEASLIRMSNVDRQVAIELRRLEGQVTEEQANDVRRLIKQIESETAAKQQSERATQDMARAWDRFAGSLADAVLDGSQGVKRWWKAMLDDMKAQLIKSGILALMQRLFGGGGGGSFAMAGGSGGIGFGQIIGSLFGGGGSGGTGSLFNAGSTMGAGFMQAVPWLAAAGGALHGYRNSGVGAAVGYGALGYAAGSVGGMALLAGGTAAAAGGSAAAIGTATASGAMAGAAAVPVIGWIIAAIAALDMVTGGKVFGTKYRPELTSQTLGIGADGGYAEAERTDVRQRSLFRGRKWNTYAIDAGDEARESAQALYDSIYETMTGAARSLAIDVPPMIDAAIRTVTQYDKKGRVTSLKIFTDALGRTWEEAISDPEDEAEIQAAAARAASRIQSEAIIAVIDAALGTTVQRAIGGTGPGIGPGRGGGPGLGDGRRGDDFEQIESTLVGAMDVVTATMGEASAIAERWRNDVELLAEGAQFLLLAASDIRAGVGLLGEGGTLTQITALIEELAQGGETLSDTYVRVAGSAALLDQALALSGVAIEGTREHIVRLATAITDAAGGLEAAQALWQSFFGNFYSDAELAAYQRAQMQASATAAFTGAGLNLADYLDPAGLARFREEFEAAMPTLSAEQIVTWLRAADALAAFTASSRQIDAALDDTDWQLYLDGLDDYARALAEQNRTYEQLREQFIAAGASVEQLTRLEEQHALALGRLIAAQAEARNEFMAGLAFDDAVAGMSRFDAEVAQINRQFDEHIAQAIALGASEQELAQIRQYGANAVARAVEAEAQRLEAARAEYADAAQGIADQLAGLRGATPYMQEMARIDRQYRDQVATLNAHARAAGFAGASERDLAMAIEVATLARAKALAQLEQEAAALAASLRMSALDAQIEALREQESAATSAISGFAGAMSEAAQAAAEAMGLLLGSYSPLRAVDKLPLALEALRRGETDANTVLQIARDVHSSGAAYNSVFDQVQEIVRAQRTQDAGTSYAGAAGGTSAQMQALLDQRAEIQAAQDAAARFGQSSQLAAMIAELSAARGEDYAAVAERLNYSLEQLAADLRLDGLDALDEYLDTLASERASIAMLFELPTAGDLAIIAAIEAANEPPDAVIDPVVTPIPVGGVQDTAAAERDAQVAADTREMLVMLRALVDRGIAAGEDTAATSERIADGVERLADALEGDGAAAAAAQRRGG